MNTLQTDNLFKTFFRYVSLNILAAAALSCYILADTFFVANALGTDGLAALNLVIPVFNLIFGFGLMFGIGGGTRYAIQKAQNRHSEADQTFTRVILLAAALSVFFELLGLFGTKQVCLFLGADGDALPLAIEYLQVIFVFAPLFLFNNVFQSFVRNDGNPKLAMTAMVVASFTNIVLDYILIYPLELDMFGAALATGVSPCVSLFILSFHSIKKKNGYHLVKCKNAIRQFLDICALGVSSLLTEFSTGIVILVFNLAILGLAANSGVAAYGVIANLAIVAIAVFTGIAQGIQPILSTCHGKGEPGSVGKVLRWGLIAAIGLAALMYVLLVLFKDPCIAVFNKENDPLLAELAAEGFPLYFAGLFFASVNIVMSGYFSAVELPARSFIVTIIRGCIAIIPLVLILAVLLGMTGVWMAFPAAELIAAILALIFLKKSSSGRKSQRNQQLS